MSIANCNRLPEGKLKSSTWVTWSLQSIFKRRLKGIPINLLKYHPYIPIYVRAQSPRIINPRWLYTLFICRPEKGWNIDDFTYPFKSSVYIYICFLRPTLTLAILFPFRHFCIIYDPPGSGSVGMNPPLASTDGEFMQQHNLSTLWWLHHPLSKHQPFWHLTSRHWDSHGILVLPSLSIIQFTIHFPWVTISRFFCDSSIFKTAKCPPPPAGSTSDSDVIDWGSSQAYLFKWHQCLQEWWNSHMTLKNIIQNQFPFIDGWIMSNPDFCSLIPHF